MADDDYYAILEVPPDADQERIRLAFRHLARLYHPDVAGTGDLARMQRLTAAYRTLGDPERRRAYDLARGIAPPEAGHAPPGGARGETRGEASPRPGAVRHSAGPLRRLAVLAARDATPVTAVAFARGGQMAGTGLIDGRVLIWDVGALAPRRTLNFGPTARAGVLQELRLSPAGELAAAWGFLLGLRIWRVADERALWTTGVSGPTGSMDAALFDAPAQLVLAVPDAPLALADDDPFRWAHEGRHGTAIFVRPLVGPVDPAWAVPRRCVEDGGRERGGAGAWRIHERFLSADGRRLLTVATEPGGAQRGALAQWDLDHRALLGGSRTRRAARTLCPPGTTWFPLAATPDLARVAVGHLERAVLLIGPAGRAEHGVQTGPLAPDARAALSPSGALLALGRGRRLDLWRTADAGQVEQWELAAEITALAFAPQAERPLLGVGLANGLCEIWG